MKKLTVFIVDNEGELTFEMEGILTSKVKNIHYFKDPTEAIKNFSIIFAKVDKTKIAIIATERHKQDSLEILSRMKEEIEKLSTEGISIKLKSSVVEYADGDSVDSLFKKAVNELT
jgi:hypothetical protein